MIDCATSPPAKQARSFGVTKTNTHMYQTTTWPSGV
jgi:hypothetical protein